MTFHGHLATKTPAEKGRIKARILVLTGAEDPMIPPQQVEAFKSEIHDLLARYRGASIKDIQLGPLLQSMSDVSFHHGVPLPASLTLTTKALAQMQQAAAGRRHPQAHGHLARRSDHR